MRQATELAWSCACIETVQITTPELIETLNLKMWSGFIHVKIIEQHENCLKR